VIARGQLEHALARIVPLAAPALTAVRGPVVVACSGGADSLCLLALAVAFDLDPVAVYVDHHLRAESAGDAALVIEVAGRLGATARMVTAAVAAGPSIEARARDARLMALEAVRAEMGAEVVLLGHTRDDQAETVLLNLLRGAAAAGLAAMATRRDALVRPMLAVPREATVEACARLGLAPVHDRMNDDLAYQRVWIRREVIPALEAGARRDLRAVLARQADVLREESDYLDALVVDVDPGDAAALAQLPRPLARRAVRRLLGSPPPALDDVDAVLAVARGERAAVMLPGGAELALAGGRLVRVASSAPAPAVHEPVTVALPGHVVLPGLTLDSWVERAAPVAWPDGRWQCVLDADVVGGEAVVRPPADGERFTPFGLAGTKLVRDALAEAGVSARARAGHPILAAPSGQPWWVVGYRIDALARVTTTTRRFLWISATEAA
jgi:tRNA(Ile)-lysidine synthase